MICLFCHAGQQQPDSRYSPEGCQKQTAPRCCKHPIRWAYTSQALTRWRHLARIRKSGLLLIYWPRRDERLSWPSWLTCSGRFTHIVVTRRLRAERRTGSVRRPKTGVPSTVLRNQLTAQPECSAHEYRQTSNKAPGVD